MIELQLSHRHHLFRPIFTFNEFNESPIKGHILPTLMHGRYCYSVMLSYVFFIRHIVQSNILMEFNKQEKFVKK